MVFQNLWPLKFLLKQRKVISRCKPKVLSHSAERLLMEDSLVFQEILASSAEPVSPSRKFSEFSPLFYFGESAV